MYLVPISAPIYTGSGGYSLSTEWKRSLVLLRDSLQGRFGPIGVVAPTRPAEQAEHVLEYVQRGEGIELFPAFPDATRLRHYWLRERRAWLKLVRGLLPRAQVVHGTVSDAFRPYCYEALREAIERGLPTVFVLDQDIIARLEQQRARTPMGPGRLLRHAQERLYERQARYCAASAGLSLFKGAGTLARYGALCADVKAIEDTSYLSSEMVDIPVVRDRLADMRGVRRELRFAFCGRLNDDKGVDQSLRILGGVQQRGIAVQFDVYGTGPALDRLRRLAGSLGLADKVYFHGARRYGAALLRELAQSDVMLFTPRIDETPRMIFDGYAAGLPLVAWDIGYARERAAADGAVHLLPREDVAASAESLAALCRDRARIEALTGKALVAARENSADEWYRRRAEWTFAMVDRHRNAGQVRVAAA